jgi:leucyl aminopeptidase
MHSHATTESPRDTEADTIAVGLFTDEKVAHDVGSGTLQALVDAGEARSAFRKLALAHAEGRRWLLVGLGAREAFDPERARVAAATVVDRAREIGTRSLCWEFPHRLTDAHAAAIVEGTVLAAYEFRSYKSAGDDDERIGIDELVVSAHHDVGSPVAAGHAAVAQGSDAEPALITITYEGPGADPGRAKLGFVGKAVTFDSGGISIKPGAKMSEMKFDMSGGAAVLAATEAIVAEQLPIRLVSVIGATENLPSGHAYRPGDILRAKTGTTIEVINTDAEGRLVLADCLAHAVEQGAERLVDVATLTGAIVSALGSTHAGLMGDDDAWCDSVQDAARASGELVWRLPLHPEYAELIKSRYADIVNAVENRKAGSITAAEFLHRFTGGVPWAHLDIAGTAWDNGRAYTAKGGAGFGARLLLELARAHAR